MSHQEVGGGGLGCSEGWAGSVLPWVRGQLEGSARCGRKGSHLSQRTLLATHSHTHTCPRGHTKALWKHSNRSTHSCTRRDNQSPTDTKTHTRDIHQRIHMPFTLKYIHTHAHIQTYSRTLLHTTSTDRRANAQAHALGPPGALTQTPKGTHSDTIILTPAHPGPLPQAQWQLQRRAHHSHILAHQRVHLSQRHAPIVYLLLYTLEHSDILTDTHRLVPSGRLTRSLPHPPLQPFPQSAANWAQPSLPTHFPPSSGASGASLRNWGRGRGGARPADVATRSPAPGLHPGQERLNGAGIPSADPIRSLPWFSDAESEALRGGSDGEQDLNPGLQCQEPSREGMLVLGTGTRKTGLQAFLLPALAGCLWILPLLGVPSLPSWHSRPLVLRRCLSPQLVPRSKPETCPREARTESHCFLSNRSPRCSSNLDRRPPVQGGSPALLLPSYVT